MNRAETSAVVAEEDIPVVLTLRWSGHPTKITLRHAGQALGVVEIGQGGEYESECRLPCVPRWEVEVKTEWPEAERESAQAVTLILEPRALPTRSETQWTYPGEVMLHRIYTVKGVEP